MQMAPEQSPGPNLGEHPDDRELIERYLVRGEESQFEALVTRYQDRIFRLALSLLGPWRAADAEDVTQEVFVRAHQNLVFFRGESRLSTWLYRLAFNLAIDHTRRARFRFPHLPANLLESRASSVGADDPYQSAATAERDARVHAAMQLLPGLMRSALYLHYWLDCSIEDISGYFGIPAGTIKSYLHRGRARLGRVLLQMGWPYEKHPR